MKKKFDSVAFQRKRREEMSKKFFKNPKAFLKSLHERFAHLRRIKTTA